MSRLRSAALLALTLVASSPAWADAPAPLRSVEQVRKLCDSAMKAATAGDYARALDLVKIHAGDTDAQQDATIDRMIEALGQYQEKFGKPVGYAFIERTGVGDFAAAWHYALKYDNWFLQWHFVFYRPEEQWKFMGADIEQVNPLGI